MDRDLRRKKGQISHIDGDRTNSSPSNLAYLCLDHHDELDSRTSQSKGLTSREVRAYRESLVARMAEERLENLDLSDEDFPKLATPNELRIGDLSATGGWRLLFKHEDHAGIEGPLFVGTSCELLIVKRPRIFSYRPGESTLQLRMDASPYLERLPRDELETDWVAHSGTHSVWPLSGGSVVVFENDPDSEGAEPEIFTNHRTDVTFGAFDRKSDTFISADADGIIKFWDWPKRSVRTTISTLLESIVSVVVDADESHLVAASEAGEFELFALKPVRSLGTGRAAVRGRAVHMWFTLDRLHLAATDDCDRWDVLDLSSLEQVPVERWYEVFVRAKVDGTEQKFLFQTANGMVAYSENEHGKLKEQALDAFQPFDRRVTNFILSADGQYAALVHEKRSLFVWERVQPSHQPGAEDGIVQ
ncbi:MAG TPA: hypothetical protein VF548_15935 [Allosphingosinicella sp.]